MMEHIIVGIIMICLVLNAGIDYFLICELQRKIKELQIEMEWQKQFYPGPEIKIKGGK